jgi:D-alanine-D-alanine ligase
MSKQVIAVFFGGKSTEHDVSIVTAIASVISPLRTSDKYQVEPVYIARDGAWYWGEALGDIALYASGKIDEYIASHEPSTVSFDGGLTLVRTSKLGRTHRLHIDVAFPAMHGTNGEDGSLMGLLRMAGVPYVGCDMEASVVAMDKVLSKQVADASKIATSKYEFFSAATFAEKPDEVVAKIEGSLKYPLFVKPAHLGSSIGISRVTDVASLQNALEVAAHYDDKIIVEEAILNLIEVTVPILGNDELEIALVERPLEYDGEFFDFDTKYMNGGKKKGGKKSGAQGYSELPAKLPGALYDECVATAKAVYRTIGCEGTARIDLLIDSKTNKVYFNEINPLPGSLYLHNWRAAGKSPLQLVERLIELASERTTKQSIRTTAFSTNFLKQF